MFSAFPVVSFDTFFCFSFSTGNLALNLAAIAFYHLLDRARFATTHMTHLDA
jgi:hypothetical protein